jgi:DNA-binding NarL/FixJ family response regulator
MKRISVLLVEDHAIVREKFRKILELEDDLEVVGECERRLKSAAGVTW